MPKKPDAPDTEVVEIIEEKEKPELTFLSSGNPLIEVIASAQHLGVDVTQRIIYLIGMIDEDCLRRFLPAFITLDSSPGQIVIILSSPGGEVMSGNAIYGLIRNANNPVTIIGLGQVFSMASIILQAADVRLLDESCRFMTHDVGHIVEEGLWTAKEHAENVKEMNEIRELLGKILSSRSGQSPEAINELMNKDSYFTAKEAVKLGFADQVIPHEKKKWQSFQKSPKKPRKRSKAS